MNVLVVGTGLIGTSVALALTRAGVDVRLDDTDPAALAAAVGRGAGVPLASGAPPADHAVLAVPPAAVAPVLARVQADRLARTASDVASVKAAPLAAAATAGCDLAAFVGGHPIAGRERSGPAAADADLLAGRPWVLTPLPVTAPATLAAAEDVVRRCGAVPVVMPPAEHDAALALVSHAPQLVASALAGLLVDAPPVALALAGSGLADTTRIAGSDPELWTQIAAANGGPLAAALDRVAATLAGVAAALRADDPGPVRAALVAGGAGRARLPGKHSRPRAPYALVPVVVPDRPGALAGLLAAAAAAGVNVEDLVIEHAPGAPLGVVELAVVPGAADQLAAALQAAGWPVHPGGGEERPGVP